MTKKTILKNLEAASIIWNCKPEDFSYMTVEYVARQIGVSVPSLSRSFKRSFGITAQECLIRVKAFGAVQLMSKKPKITVKELAAALDYNSTSQFIAAFKKHVGFTPGELLRSPARRWAVCNLIRSLFKYRKFNNPRRQTPNIT